MQYAASIFALGGDLLSALEGHSPKPSPHWPLASVRRCRPRWWQFCCRAIFELNPRPLLTITEGAPETLAAQLVSRSLQFVLADVQLGKRSQKQRVGALHSRMLLESAVELFAPPALARKLRKNFPAT